MDLFGWLDGLSIVDDGGGMIVVLDVDSFGLWIVCWEIGEMMVTNHR